MISLSVLTNYFTVIHRIYSAVIARLFILVHWWHLLYCQFKITFHKPYSLGLGNSILSPVFFF